MAKSKRMSESDDDEPDGDSLKKLFEEEMKKPYYDVSYLDNFKLPYDKLDVSIIIPTYNRCPYKPNTLKEENNPLVWGIKTALMQKVPAKEIVVVDDASEDNTEAIVNKYKDYAKKKGLTPIKYIRNEKRLGAAVIRNIGVSQANGKYLFFSDDDLFMSPYAVFGAVYTYEWLRHNDVKVGIMNLPFYSRATHPNKIVKKADVARVSFLKGEYTANKNAFPEEYLENLASSDKFIHQEYHILRPLPIENSGGYSLCEKDVFMKVGGFPENIIKRGEDRELGFRFIENGYPVYFTPDPKFQGVHGSYGLKIGREFEGDDWFKKMDKTISLKKAMNLCDNPKKDTGARIDPMEYIYDAILSFFILSYIRNKRGAMKWIKKVEESFVVGGKTTLFGNGDVPAPSEKIREKMLVDAVEEGLNFIINLEINEIKKMKEAVAKMKETHNLDENIFKSWEDF